MELHFEGAVLILVSSAMGSLAKGQRHTHESIWSPCFQPRGPKCCSCFSVFRLHLQPTHHPQDSHSTIHAENRPHLKNSQKWLLQTFFTKEFSFSFHLSFHNVACAQNCKQSCIQIKPLYPTFSIYSYAMSCSPQHTLQNQTKWGWMSQKFHLLCIVFVLERKKTFKHVIHVCSFMHRIRYKRLIRSFLASEFWGVDTGLSCSVLGVGWFQTVFSNPALGFPLLFKTTFQFQTYSFTAEIPQITGLRNLQTQISSCMKSRKRDSMRERCTLTKYLMIIFTTMITFNTLTEALGSWFRSRLDSMRNTRSLFWRILSSGLSIRARKW